MEAKVTIMLPQDKKCQEPPEAERGKKERSFGKEPGPALTQPDF
jgi:hypothetical protein